MLRVAKSSSVALTVGFSVLSSVCRNSIVESLCIKKKFV